MANDIIDIIVTDNSDNVQLNVTPNLVSINVSQTSGNIIGSNYYLASTFSALPITGDLTTLYVINDTSLMYRWSGSAYTQINSSAVVAWGQITGTLSGQTDLQNALNAKAPLASPTFTGTVSGITKSMVGLSNVDNTSDVNKPISTATQTALNLKADINNPTFTGTVGGITKAMVGLGNVDNTSDVNKPISSATQTALDTKAPLASPTFTGTVSGITKSMVGLGNVDNTTDLLKPISTATQSALNLKYDASNPAGYTTNVGTVTSVGGTGTVSGLSLSGSVTTSGNLTLGGTLSLTSGNVTTALGYTPYNATNPSGYISGITSGQVTTALGYTPENSANKGIANGYASLDGGGLVPSTQLPSYVDDVLEFADLASFPASGTTGKIYVALDTNKIYRWSGATYIEVSPTVGTIWGGITGTLSNQTDLQTALNAKQNNLSGTGFVKSTAGTISYDTATYYPYPTGTTTQYVAGDGSLIAFPVAGQAGTIVRLVRNQTGATLTKGTVVYIDGATGNNPTVAKAIATGDSTSAQTFGLCQANISNNAEGYVVIMGDLVGLNTSSFTEGQQLYLSSTTAGEYTTTKQYAPAHLVYVGVVTRSHVSLGQIEVRIQNGYEMDELHNVSAQSPTNNDGLFYNTTTSLWEKKSIATVLGYTPANAARSLTINGTAYDLTADRSWSVGTVTSVAALTLGTTGTDVSSSVATGTTTPVITLNIPTASATNRGALSATDWSTFNNKQTALSGTGFVKISGTTISYDNSTYLTTASASSTYQTIITNPVTGTGTTNYIPKFTSSSAIGNSSLSDDGTTITSASNIYINRANPFVRFKGTTLDGYIINSNDKLYIADYNTATKNIVLDLVTGVTTFSNNVVLSGSDSRINGGDSVGRLILSNSNTTTYITLYGASHATLPYVMSFVVNSASALQIASAGAATFSSSVTAGGVITSDSFSTAALPATIGSTQSGGHRLRLTTNGASTAVIDYGTAGGSGGWIQASIKDSLGTTLPLLLNPNGGNVGIGTSSPSFALDVDGKGGNAYIRVNTIGSSNWSTLLLQNGDGSWHLTNDNTGTFNIGTGNDPSDLQKFTINSAGRVGIGTTSPLSIFHISSPTVAYGQIKIINTSTTGDSAIQMGRSNQTDEERWTVGQGVGGIGNNFGFYASGSSKLNITNGGNILIGTATDSGYKFEVSGGSSAVATRVISSGSTTAGTLWDGGGAPSFHAWSRPQDCGIGSNNFTGASILIKTGMSYGSFSTGTTRIEIQSGGAVIIPGSLSKGSGSFRIDHPLKPDTHQLVHSFIEGPQADLIYRGKLTLINGKAQANIDEVSTMTEGTFEALCREVQCFTTNENGWDLVKGKVIGNIIYIESQNPNSTDEISWMVIGERKDKHMMDTEWTDNEGKVILEPLKEIK